MCITLIRLTIIFLASLLAIACNGTSGKLIFNHENYQVLVNNNIEVQLSISGATSVSGLVVRIFSSNKDVLQLSHNTCVLSDESDFPKSCIIIINGRMAGSTLVTAEADNIVVASANVSVMPNNSYKMDKSKPNVASTSTLDLKQDSSAQVKSDKNLKKIAILPLKKNRPIANSHDSNNLLNKINYKNLKLQSRVNTNSKGNYYLIITLQDTLFRISQDSGISVECLKKINHLKDNKVIIGKRLYLSTSCPLRRYK